MHAVRVEGLTREYVVREGRRRRRTTRTALAGVDLTVPVGTTHGLLGPNGAGKTTLVKILSTILLPTAGVVEVFGHDVVADPRPVRRLIGLVLGGDRGYYHGLTARQNLRFWASAYGYSRAAGAVEADRLIERFGLADRADSPVHTFSRGMRQRLHLARGLIGDPRLLVLDEPTIGMDPLAAAEFRDIVRDLVAEGRSMLITTHDMAEAEQLCAEVTLIDQGRVLATETPRTLSTWLARYEHLDVDGLSESAAADVAAVPGVGGVTVLEDGRWRIATTEQGAVKAVIERLLAHGITSVRVGRPTLAEVYVQLVGGDRGLKV